MDFDQAPLVLFDFGSPAAVAEWGPIDDRVMGGLSRSRLRHDPAGHAVFEGEVSLERNGGFASVRSAPGPLGRAGAEAVVVELRGQGPRFKLNLRVDDNVDGLNYQAVLQPEGTWSVMRIPLSVFRPTFRGRDVAGAPPLDPARIRQVGLMTVERRAGPFALAIRRIALA